MRRIRTRRFHLTLRAAFGFSALFLAWLFLFGKSLATSHFTEISYCVFSVLVIAAASFLAFCFIPYFHGDKRWFAIPALLTVVFLAGTVVLWQVPLPEVML